MKDNDRTKDGWRVFLRSTGGDMAQRLTGGGSWMEG